MDIPREDIEALRREKYGGDAGATMHTDLARLMKGEPLAYVIGTQPFLGLTLHLDSHPLIPRPETEWWTEELVRHIGDRTLTVLDLCAGSGAIGLAVLKHCPHATVSFSDIRADHIALIEKNIKENALDASRAHFYTGDLFAPLPTQPFDLIATNPPYIPSERALDTSVTDYEPADALYGGTEGLDFITRIIEDAPSHLTNGELWIECDTTHAEEVKHAMETKGFKARVRIDQYGRPRLVIGVLA